MTKNLKSLNRWAYVLVTLFLCNSCDNENSEDFSNEDLGSLIIGTWQVYDIQILDKDKNEIDFPDFLKISVECQSRTKYIFSSDGSLEILHRMNYQQAYNQENQPIGYECVPSEEGGGFKSGTWKIEMDSNGEEYLDLDWIYNTGSTPTDGVWWKPDFITEKSFSLGGYWEEEEIYFFTYYRRTD